MPARVARAIEAQRERGEILTSWVQAGLLVVFASLYFLAPSTSPVSLPMRPVPWALAIYAIFTALRLHLAYRGRLSGAMRVASVVIDMALLTVTIWSFHLEYGQPAAFYLKAPTFTYFFIFVALRALSFSPGYVLLAGGTAALGWLALLGYALAEPGAIDLVTRNYVEYMTSARILIGGEVDKIISLLLVSALLAIAVARTRQLLERAVLEEAASTQMARFFSPEVAETLINADELLRPGEGESREAAVMFIDLRGFTVLAASLEPRALIALLGEYQHIAVPIVQRHHGSITTYLGDGVMITFGATRPNSTYAADAMRCAEAIIDALDKWAEERRARGAPAPGVGLGLEVGTVICGAIGEEGRLEYAVIGDPVNRAAKLQNHTKAQGVRALTTAFACERAIAQGYQPSRAQAMLAAREVAGVAGRIDLVVIR
ncbi:MAG TPA: adenylate/guanylate cyclase domain-containing protein [Burkholderiales bacterium]|nr:adenylate/guanylate cyclase domain-containing protein [Burkholderiales bacterium]